MAGGRSLPTPSFPHPLLVPTPPPSDSPPLFPQQFNPGVLQCSVSYRGVGGYVSGTKKMIDSETPEEVESGGDEEYDGCTLPCAKKRRLAANQVQFLERSFEVENKLEPERKAQLAKQLGLHPRQVAIWFQNRRARYKTKQLEKDYDSLKAKFDELRADYDTLVREGDSLRQQLASLKDKLREREKVKEEAISGTAKSDVVDSGSPRLMGDLWLETANSATQIFEPEMYSDGLSQDDEDEDPLNQRLRIFPKLELESGYGRDEEYTAGSPRKIELCEGEDQFWGWPY